MQGSTLNLHKKTKLKQIMKQTAAFLIIFLILTSLANGQNTLYFMDCLPQNRSMNPAMVPGEKFYLGLPGIGGVKGHAYNSGFNLGEFQDFYDNVGMANYNPDEFNGCEFLGF